MFIVGRVQGEIYLNDFGASGETGKNNKYWVQEAPKYYTEKMGNTNTKKAYLGVACFSFFRDRREFEAAEFEKWANELGFSGEGKSLAKKVTKMYLGRYSQKLVYTPGKYIVTER
ncbi:hypothetical protein [Brazilian marseillevirus]|uniref:hypothetical protein n=1 Tax=Brazilian marseillevirus TaxID=1813599 RepID=UPI000784FDA7|nr:hypothetical protein A3303_gp006 [Brazilian marseillevirus]AMQ10514.1 hypothetical protein [Brazilian marseillevirus]